MLTPDNYDAYKGRQRLQDDARKQFLTMTKLEGDNSSPVSDAQLSDRVANLTGGRPAPEDMVRANRELFREADDTAWADGIRIGSPKTLAMLSDPRSGPISRADVEAFAAIEQTLSNVGKLPGAVGGGAPLRGVQLASASGPEPDPRDNTVLPPLPLPNPTRSAPAGTPPEADEGTGTPSVGAPVAAPASGVSAAVPLIEGSGQAFAAGGAGAEARVSIGSADLPTPIAGDETAAWPPSIEGSGRASAIAGAGTQASANVNVASPPAAAPDEKVAGTAPSVEGGGEASAEVAPGAQASVSADAAAQSAPPTLTPAERIARNGWYMNPVPGPGPISETGKAAANAVVGKVVGGSAQFLGHMMSALSDAFVYPTTEGHFDLARRISQARYAPKEEVAAINQDIDRLAVSNKTYGATSFEQAQDAQIAQMRQTLSDVLDGRMQPKEAFDLLQPLFGGLSHMVTETTAAKLAALAPRISQARTASKRQLATLDRDIDLLLSGTDRKVVRSTLESVLSGAMAPDRALDSLQRWLNSPLDTLGKDLQRGGDTVRGVADEYLSVSPEYKGSIYESIGDALGIAGSLAVAAWSGGLGAGVFLGGTTSGGDSLDKAIEANADKSTQTKAAGGGFFWGALTSLPLERLFFNPAITSEKTALKVLEWLGKKPVAEGTKNALQQIGQNITAISTYDPNRDWSREAWSNFLGGAIAGGIFDLGGIALARRASLKAFSDLEAKAQATKQQQTTMQTVLDQSAGMKLREQSPESFESFLNGLSKNGPLEHFYLRAKNFDEYYRSKNVDPLTIIDKLNGVSRTDFATALASGGDLRVPVAAYAAHIVGTDADTPLRQHLRVDPNHTTSSETDTGAAEPATATPTGASSDAPANVPSPATGRSSPSPNYPHESAKGKTEQQRENEVRREAEARQRAAGAKIRENNTAKKREAARQHKLENEAKKRAFWETQKGLSEGSAPSSDKDALMRSVSPWSPY